MPENNTSKISDDFRNKLNYNPKIENRNGNIYMRNEYVDHSGKFALNEPLIQAYKRQIDSFIKYRLYHQSNKPILEDYTRNIHFNQTSKNFKQLYSYDRRFDFHRQKFNKHIAQNNNNLQYNKHFSYPFNNQHSINKRSIFLNERERQIYSQKIIGYDVFKNLKKQSFAALPSTKQNCIDSHLNSAILKQNTMEYIFTENEKKMNNMNSIKSKLSGRDYNGLISNIEKFNKNTGKNNNNMSLWYPYPYKNSNNYSKRSNFGNMDERKKRIYSQNLTGNDIFKIKNEPSLYILPKTKHNCIGSHLNSAILKQDTMEYIFTEN